MAEPEKPASEGPAAAPRKIIFNYIKSSQFRTIHADGVFGGVTPNGQVFMTVFSERPPIPQQMVHSVQPVDGGLAIGLEIQEERVSRKGIVREVEVGIIMNADNVIALRDWLNDKLKILDRLEE